MTTICFWNIRGLSNPVKQRDRQSLIRSRKPSILCLAEVKIRSTKIHRAKLRIWRRAGSLHTCSTSNKVRVWVLWDQESVRIEPICQTEDLIAQKCTHLSTNKEWFMGAIYASNWEMDRRRLWATLEVCIERYIGPWMLSGDFNCVRYQNEKTGVLSEPSSKLIPFNSFIESSGLSDLKITGAKWTWMNRQQTKPIACKLDRVPVNDEWYNSFCSSHCGQNAPKRPHSYSYPFGGDSSFQKKAMKILQQRYAPDAWLR